MVENKFHEYRKWVFMWGLFLDGQKTIQKEITKHNEEGWKVVQFEWNSSFKFSIIHVLKVMIVTICTLGFVSYWSGATMIFEREKQA
jgi:hypothetical protein